MHRVETPSGRIAGIESEPGIRVFKGIPYARPPVGDLRWRPPVPVEPWSGTFMAKAFGASCYQETHSSDFVWRRGAFPVSEDCLYLNVWAHTDAELLPVMVWFHGGAHTSGQGHARIFDGTSLAKSGVVLVTINYRLGPFGFLAHPWLVEESGQQSAGNYGLLDKIAALEWVRDHIAAFGGDPGKVTIFGQSAGSQSVCSLMTSPLAHGLFHRAIGQSAACVDPMPTRDPQGLERGSELVASLQAGDSQELRRLPADLILKLSDTTGWNRASRIVIDGWVLPEPQVEVFRRGAQAQVPLLVGSLANEGVKLFPEDEQFTQTQLDAFLERRFQSGSIQRVKAAYRKVHESPGAIQHAIATDFFMAFGMRRWSEYQVAAGSPAFLYFMDQVPPAFHLYMPETPALELPDGPRSSGAYHSGCLAYVFGNTRLVGLHWEAADHALSAQLVGYWTNFARTGDPNGPGLPEWKPFTSAAAWTQRLGPRLETVPGVRKERLDAIGEAFPM